MSKRKKTYSPKKFGWVRHKVQPGMAGGRHGVIFDGPRDNKEQIIIEDWDTWQALRRDLFEALKADEAISEQFDFSERDPDVPR